MRQFMTDLWIFEFGCVVKRGGGSGYKGIGGGLIKPHFQWRCPLNEFAS
mgnify:CR=1 FL=1